MRLTAGDIKRYRDDPVLFVNSCLVNPATGRPYELLDAEKVFLRQAFRLDKNGKLLAPLLIYSAIKKSGKTEFAGIFIIVLLVLFAERFAEAYCIANDREQAESRVFEICKRLVAASPLLKDETKVLSGQILFPSTGAKIIPVAGDYAGAAGGHPSIAVFDEIWGFTSERARRVFDEFVPVPTRKISCRLIVSHAGFENESELLRELYVRGLKQPKIGTDLHAGDGMLMFWSHVPIASWQDAQWLAEMKRSLRGSQYLRMIENRFVTSESTFIPMEWYDACVDENLYPTNIDKKLPVVVAVDASVKRDSTAIIAVTWDGERVRVVWHRIMKPRPDKPIEFEDIYNTIGVMCNRYRVQKVVFDPYQMESVAQRLKAQFVPIEPMAQSTPTLTAIGTNLYDLLKSKRIVFYPDDDIRLAMSRTVAVEIPSRSAWKLTKEKASHHVDIIVALAMAAHAVVETIADPNEGLVTAFNRDPALGADALNPGGGGNGITLTKPYNKPVLGGERTTAQMQRARGGMFVDRFAGPGGWRPNFR